MKRRAEFLVEKRDGRTEWLRSTKLARSIHLALLADGIDESWRALDLASAVLAGLRACAGAGPYLSTAAVADAVQQVLLATGHAGAAGRYASVGAERHRRRQAVQRLLVEGRGGLPESARADGSARRE